jgi:phage gpG-like protein
MSFTNAFRSLRSKTDQLLRESTQLVAVLAERHYRDNFRAAGFMDATLERWKPLTQRSGKPLNKSGVLKGSIRAMIIGHTVKIATDTPYAQYQQEGTRTIPARRFIGPSKALNKKLLIEITRLAKRILN